MNQKGDCKMKKTDRMICLGLTLMVVFTMINVRFISTNPYNGRTVGIEFLTTAEAGGKTIKGAMPAFPAHDTLKTKDDIWETLLTESMYVFYVLSYCPEIFDMLPPENQDILNDKLLSYNGSYNSDTRELLQVYTETYDSIIVLENLVARFLEDTIPLQKNLNPQSGKELYSLAKRIVLEFYVTLGCTASGATDMQLLDSSRNEADQIDAYLRKFDANYDYDTYFKQDLAVIKPLYSRVYKNLAQYYSNHSISMTANGARLIEPEQTTDVFANLEPYDASLELPFEKILDPFEAVDESFEKEIAMVGMIFTLEDFYRVGGLNQIVTYTDYDVNDGSGKLLWDYVINSFDGKIQHYNIRDFDKYYAAYKDFIPYLVQYFKLCHLDRAELVADNGQQWLLYCHGLFYAQEYVKLLYGHVLNDPTFTHSQFDDELVYPLNFNVLDSSIDMVYEANYEITKPVYAQVYGELIAFNDLMSGMVIFK